VGRYCKCPEAAACLGTAFGEAGPKRHRQHVRAITSRWQAVHQLQHAARAIPQRKATPKIEYCTGWSGTSRLRGRGRSPYIQPSGQPPRSCGGQAAAQGLAASNSLRKTIAAPALVEAQPPTEQASARATPADEAEPGQPTRSPRSSSSTRAQRPPAPGRRSPRQPAPPPPLPSTRPRGHATQPAATTRHYTPLHTTARRRLTPAHSPLP
jgi:hypothetical protein